MYLTKNEYFNKFLLTDYLSAMFILLHLRDPILIEGEVACTILDIYDMNNFTKGDQVQKSCKIAYISSGQPQTKTKCMFL